MSRDNLQRILVIDDNEAIHRDFRKILASESENDELASLEAEIFDGEDPPDSDHTYDFQLEFALQGEEGIGLLEESLENDERFALAFVDVRMPPGLDGIETVRKLWKRDPDLEVVICTAHADYTWEELVSELDDPHRFIILKKPFDPTEVRQLAHALCGKRNREEFQNDRLGDLEQSVERRSVELEDANDRLEQAYQEVVNLNDELRRQQQQIEHLATHDSLTGLPNRSALVGRLRHEIERRRRYPETRFALLCLDVDRFKVVNDSLGHRAGDQLLLRVAERIRSGVRGVDMVARLGGDEFTVLIEDVGDEKDALEVADRIHGVFSEPFRIDDMEVTSTASIGIVMSSDEIATPADALRSADLAMYAAKQRGGDATRLYDPENHRRAISRLSLENELRRAVEQEEFILHYQPIVDLDSLHLVGAEALIRWQHPERGLLYPGAFIGTAEESGVMLDIGRWVMEESCRQIAEWTQLRGDHGFFVSVNASALQLVEPDLTDEVSHLLESSSIDPGRLKLEVVESVVIDMMDTVQRNLQGLRDLGVGISLDDFGTGYSSLSFLHRLPATTIKIDRSFVADIEEKERSADLVRAIIRVGETLKLNVIAEGIENANVLEQLREMRCSLAQGFYFSKGVTAEELSKLLKAQPSRIIADAS